MVGLLGCGCCKGGDDPPVIINDPLCRCFATDPTAQPILFNDKFDPMYNPDFTCWRFLEPFAPGWFSEYYINGTRRYHYGMEQYIRNRPSPYIPNDGAVRYVTNFELSKPHPYSVQYFSLDFTNWNYEFEHKFDLDMTVCPDWTFSVQNIAWQYCFYWYRSDFIGSLLQAFKLSIEDTNAASRGWFGPCGPWRGVLDFGSPFQIGSRRRFIRNGTHTIKFVWKLDSTPIFPATARIIQDTFLDGVLVVSQPMNYQTEWVASGCAFKKTPWLRFCWSGTEYADLTAVNQGGYPQFGDNWVGLINDLLKLDEWSMTAVVRQPPVP